MAACSIARMAIAGALHVVLTIVNICLYGNPWTWALGSLKYWNEEHCQSGWIGYKQMFHTRRQDAYRYNARSIILFQQKYDKWKRQCETNYLHEFNTAFDKGYYRTVCNN